MFGARNRSFGPKRLFQARLPASQKLPFGSIAPNRSGNISESRWLE